MSAAGHRSVGTHGVQATPLKLQESNIDDILAFIKAKKITMWFELVQPNGYADEGLSVKPIRHKAFFK